MTSVFGVLLRILRATSFIGTRILLKSASAQVFMQRDAMHACTPLPCSRMRKQRGLRKRLVHNFCLTSLTVSVDEEMSQSTTLSVQRLAPTLILCVHLLRVVMHLAGIQHHMFEVPGVAGGTSYSMTLPQSHH